MSFLMSTLVLMLTLTLLMMIGEGTSQFSSPVKVVRYSDLPSTKRVSSARYFRRFHDERGRERYFRGVNVVFKGPPWIPIIDHYDRQLSFSRQDWTVFKALGFNIVRLGVMWPGVEPRRGEYNQTYLDSMRDLALQLLDFDIYVLLDMHQDTFHEKFCGEGVPDWAVKVTAKQGFPYPVDKPYNLSFHGYPRREDCSKNHKLPYEMSAAHASAVQNLYDNVDGLLDSFARFWGKVAETFKDLPNLIGYNIINEPYAGDSYKRPWLLTPMAADKFNLQRVYDRVHEEIRRIDQVNMVFFEGVTWENTVGFTRVPGGHEYANRSVLSFHHYDYLPFSTSAKTSFFYRTLDLRRLGCAGMLTETETSFDYRGDDTDYAAVNVRKEAYKHLFSVIGWCYKRFFGITGDGDTLFRSEGFHYPTASVLSWPFPPAIAGRLNSMFYDNETCVFEMRFNLDSRIEYPTEIIVQEQLHYSKGFKVFVEPKSSMSVRLERTKERQTDLDDLKFLTEKTGLTGLATKIILDKTTLAVHDQEIFVRISSKQG